MRLGGWRLVCAIATAQLCLVLSPPTPLSGIHVGQPSSDCRGRDATTSPVALSRAAARTTSQFESPTACNTADATTHGTIAHTGALSKGSDRFAFVVLAAAVPVYVEVTHSPTDVDLLGDTSSAGSGDAEPPTAVDVSVGPAGRGDMGPGELAAAARVGGRGPVLVMADAHFADRAVRMARLAAGDTPGAATRADGTSQLLSCAQVTHKAGYVVHCRNLGNQSAGNKAARLVIESDGGAGSVSSHLVRITTGDDAGDGGTIGTTVEVLAESPATAIDLSGRATRRGTPGADAGEGAGNSTMAFAESVVTYGGELRWEGDVAFNAETGGLPLVGVPATTARAAGVTTTTELESLPSHAAFMTSGSCDNTGACRFRNVVLDTRRNRVWMLRLADAEGTPPFNLTVTTHKRQLEAVSNGWDDPTKLWGLNAALMAAPAPHDVHEGIESAVSECVENPTVLAAVPMPLHYWHSVVEGVLPLLHVTQALQREYENDDDAQQSPQRVDAVVVLAQPWLGRIVPRFLQQLLSAVVDRPVLDTLTTFNGNGGASQAGDVGAGGLTCFKDLTIGHNPRIESKAQLLAAAGRLMRRMGVPPAQPLPWPWPSTRVPRLVIAQRGARCYANFRTHTDAGDDVPSRTIINARDLALAAAANGFAPQVVYMEALTPAEQMEVMTRADVFVAVHGSAWANAAFLPSRSVAVQLFGRGMKNPACTVAQQYRSISQVPGFFHSFCDAMLSEFRSVVPGWYLEWEPRKRASGEDAGDDGGDDDGDDASSFVAPFNFADEYCQSDGAGGVRRAMQTGPADVSIDACRTRETAAQATAIADPPMLWRSNFTRAHQFLKNAHVRMDVGEFVAILRQARALLDVPRGPATQ